MDRYGTLRAGARDAFEVICAERGIVPPDTVALASAALLAVMDCLQVHWPLDPTDVDLAKASEQPRLRFSAGGV